MGRRSMAANKSGIALGSISLALGLVVFVPSAAAFTPAIFLSIVALVGAVVGAALGAVRTGILTLLVVASTVVVSPLSPTEPWFSSLRAEYWMVGMAVSWAIVAERLLVNYRRRNGA